MENHLYAIGTVFIALAVVHVIFPRYFQWKTELASLQLVNRQMMQVHTFFIALMVLLMGLLCITDAQALCHTPLGKTIAKGFFIFWFCRLLFQLFVYSPKLWKGKTFETIVHVFFTGFWVYLSVVFWWIAWA